MPLPTGHSRLGSVRCMPNSGSCSTASYTSSTVISFGARARLQPAPAPWRTSTRPARRRSPRLRRMITGLVFTLAATWSEVRSSCPRRWASAIHASACTAIVSRLFAAIIPPSVTDSVTTGGVSSRQGMLGKPRQRRPRRPWWPPGSRQPAGESGSWAGAAEQWQDSGSVAGVAAQRGGDVAVAMGVQDADGEVAQAGHGPGGGAGADLASVLGKGGVTDVVQRLDAPVPSDPVGQAGGASLGGGEAGDRVDRHGPPPPPGQRPDPAGNAQGLGGVGEVQAGDGGDLQAAGLDPAVAAVAGAVGDGDLAPGQASQLVVQGGLVALDDQEVGGVLVGDQPLGVLPLGVQRVGGDHGVGKVQAV